VHVEVVGDRPVDQVESIVAEVLQLADGFPEHFPLPYNTLVWCTTRS